MDESTFLTDKKYKPLLRTLDRLYTKVRALELEDNDALHAFEQIIVDSGLLPLE